jgi:hypothetical protein
MSPAEIILAWVRTSLAGTGVEFRKRPVHSRAAPNFSVAGRHPHGRDQGLPRSVPGRLAAPGP